MKFFKSFLLFIAALHCIASFLAGWGVGVEHGFSKEVYVLLVFIATAFVGTVWAFISNERNNF